MNKLDGLSRAEVMVKFNLNPADPLDARVIDALASGSGGSDSNGSIEYQYSKYARYGVKPNPYDMGPKEFKLFMGIAN